jgi:tetratricopeptide (TPR) repeat protein
MSVFDDFEAFPFGDPDDEFGDGRNRSGDNPGSESASERRKKYFEEELRRYREDKKRKLMGDSPAESDDPPQRQFLHPDILEELVDYCVENQKFDEALDFVHLLTERAPFNGDGWHRRGMLEAHHGRYDQAVASYERALALNPADNELLINYGIALDALGRSVDALEVFERALTTDPGNDEALFNKGICFEKAERFDEAISIFTYLRDSKDIAKDALYELGFCYDCKQDFEKALAAY